MKGLDLPIKCCFLVASLFFCGCEGRQLKEINVDKKIADYMLWVGGDTSRVTAQFCDLITIVSWDEVVVLGPYTSVQSISDLKIDNIEMVKDSLSKVSLDEGKCTLIYLKSKTAVAYSVVSRSPIDFVRQGVAYYRLNHQECSSFMFEKLKDGRFRLTSIKPLNI